MSVADEVIHPEDIEHPAPARKDLIAAWLADRCSTVEFALANLLVIGGWSFVGVEPFPYPFLTLVLSVEAIMLTVFVLVQQRLQATMVKRESDADLKNDAIAAQASQDTLDRLDKILKHMEKDSQ